MQFNTLATILAFAGAALAQDFSNVPKCAEAPALAVFGKTGCSLSNIKCICSATSFVSELETAIKAACSASDLAKANAFAVSTCQQAGVNLSIPGFTTSGGSSATATDSSTGSSGTMSTTTSSGASAMTTTSGMSTAMTSGTPSLSSAAGTQTTSTDSTETSSTATTSASTGAANTLQIGGSALFGGLLAVLAL